MLFNKAKQLLKENGYVLIESEADIFMEIEDIFGDRGYDAKEISYIMSEYTHIIANLVDNGRTAEEIVDNILDRYFEDETLEEIRNGLLSNDYSIEETEDIL